MSPRIVLITILLASAGCNGKGDAKVPDPGATRTHAPRTTAEPTAQPTAPETKADPEAPDRPSPGPSAAYRRPGDPAAGVDEFVFWGWSEDGRYYAFETQHHGSDMAHCEGEVELTIVDAQADRYAADGHVLLEYEDAEAKTCDPPDLAVELAHRRGPLLERYGISAGYLGGPIGLEGRDERWSFAPPDGGAVDLTFRVKHGTDDPMEAADGAAFVLKIKQPGMSEVVVEDGRRRRPWTLRYGLAEGMVFVGPKGRQAAIMVAQHETMPEGVRTTWMSSGITLR